MILFSGGSLLQARRAANGFPSYFAVVFTFSPEGQPAVGLTWIAGSVADVKNADLGLPALANTAHGAS